MKNITALTNFANVNEPKFTVLSLDENTRKWYVLLRFIYMSDFRDKFRIKIVHFWKQKYSIF